MLNLSNMLLQENLQDISDDTLMQYMTLVASWMESSIDEAANGFIQLLNNNDALSRTLKSQIQDELGDPVKCYRTLSFSKKKIKARKELLGPDPQKGQSYSLESYGKRTLFSWTTSREFAFQWHQPQSMKLSSIMVHEKYTFESDIPASSIVFAMDMMPEWHTWLHQLKSRGLQGGSKDKVKAYTFVRDMFDMFWRQHEVIVWHKMPIQAKLIDKYIDSND